MTKKCSKCGEEKPFDAFRGRAASKDGRQAWCGACLRLYQKERRDDPEYLNNQRKLQCERTRARRTDPKLLARERELTQERMTDPEYRAKVRERGRKRRRSSPELHNQRKRDWRKTAQGLASSYKERMMRRGVIEDAPPDEDLSAWVEIVRNDPCAYCGMQSGKMQVEHIQPVSKGGQHTTENIVGACPSCNAAKRDKPLLTFLLDRKADAGLS